MGWLLFTGERSVVFVREFTADPVNVDLEKIDLHEVVERLRKFFLAHYISFAEKIHSPLKFDEIPAEKKGNLGLVIGGFSPGSLQSELWEIVVPINSAEYSATRHCGAGEYGCRWFALAAPIARYANGLDIVLSQKLLKTFEDILGRGLTDEEQAKFIPAIEECRYRFDFNGMPIQSGIDCARFFGRYGNRTLSIC